MASKTDNRKYESKLEKGLSSVQSTLSSLGTVVRNMYDHVTELVERTDHIYDMVAHRQDGSLFDHSNGYDLS